MRRHGPVIAHCTDSEDFPPLQISGENLANHVNSAMHCPTVLNFICWFTNDPCNNPLPVTYKIADSD